MSVQLFRTAVERNGALAEQMLAATLTHRAVFSTHEIPPGQEYKQDLVEIYGVSTGIADARECHPCVSLHPVWLANELAMYLSRDDPKLAALAYLPREECLRFHALDGDNVVRHYGYTVADIYHIADRLERDPESKRMLFVFQRPEWLTQDASETPCAIATQYLLRDNKLWTISGYRSHDFFAGCRMDPIRISLVQQAVAKVLYAHDSRITVGPLIIQEGSLHYYPNRKHRPLQDEIDRAVDMGKWGVVFNEGPTIAATLDFFEHCPPYEVVPVLQDFIECFRRVRPPTARLLKFSPPLARILNLAIDRYHGLRCWA